MGIQASTPSSLAPSQALPLPLKGRRCAVDGYVAARRAAGALKLATGQPSPVRRAVHGAHVVTAPARLRRLVVFDGAPCPAKGRTPSGASPAQARGAHELLREAAAGGGRPVLTQSVTPDLAVQLIDVLRREGIEFIVAPYEADSQLAHLARTNAVDFVVTEAATSPPSAAKICSSSTGAQRRPALPPRRPRHPPRRRRRRRRRGALRARAAAALPRVGRLGLGPLPRPVHPRGLRLPRPPAAPRNHHGPPPAARQGRRREGGAHPRDGAAAAAGRSTVPPQVPPRAQAFLHQRVYDPTLKRIVPLAAARRR